MTYTEHKELIKKYVDNIKRYMQEAGGMFPHITIFAKKLDAAEDEKDALIHIPIPEKYIESDGDKDQLVDEILPYLYEKLKESFQPYGVAWASEAWMRIAKTKEELKDYKNTPIKKEVLMISVETDYKSENLIYDIERNGQQINSDGELIDQIKLIKTKEVKSSGQASGRFVGLYNKLK